MYRMIGLMSGTSLDGVDIAACTFRFYDARWTYHMDVAETVPYPEEWLLQLRRAPDLSAREFARLHAALGNWYGEQVRRFLDRNRLEADYVASHGHTVFHQPSGGYTTQIGCGAHLAAQSGLPVICDFRSADVALGGQGAPLVPLGDRILFGAFDFCLNLGGIANISWEIGPDRLAFDICPVNMVLNDLASQAGAAYDRNGEIARSGELLPDLLTQLNGLDYYRQPPPKSLGAEWVEKEFRPLLRQSAGSTRDLLATCTEHAAVQIGAALQGWKGSLLVTGGGTWNSYLVERIRAHVQAEVVIPDPLTVNFKEALVFAFLGVRFLRREINALASVTGAVRDSVGGCLYHP